MEHCAKMETKPGSIKKYLQSLVDFCTFILSDGAEIRDVDSEDVLKMKLKVAAWRRSYKQQDKIQGWKKDYADYQMLVTPEQVEKYENGVNACTAKSLFQ